MSRSKEDYESDGQDSREGDSEPDDETNIIDQNLTERKNKRKELGNLLWVDQRVNSADWTSGKKDLEYRPLLQDCLNHDQRPLPPEAEALDCMNTLQFILSKGSHWGDNPARLEMAKCIIRLVIELGKERDNGKLSILHPTGKGSETKLPLFMAIEFDIQDTKNGSPPTNLTQYMCQQLPKSDAAIALALTNDKNETCLHQAVLKDLEGVEDLIQLANKDIFHLGRSAAGEEGDGNTLLHDALKYEKTVSLFPRCNGTEAHGLQSEQLNLLDSLKEGGARTTRSKLEDRTGEETGNEIGDAGGTVSLQVTTQYPNKALCTTCADVYEAFKHLKSRRKRIIVELMKRDAHVLRAHNAAGQSPYLYYRATKQGHLDMASRERTSARSSTLKETSGSNKVADEQVAVNPKIKNQKDTKILRTSKDSKDQKRPTEIKEASDAKHSRDIKDPKELKVVKDPKDRDRDRDRNHGDENPLGKRTETPAKTPDGSVLPVSPELSFQNAFRDPRIIRRDSTLGLPAGSKQSPNTARRRDGKSSKPHRKEILQKKELWPDLEKELKEQAFAMGDYDGAYDCLFPKQQGHNGSHTGTLNYHAKVNLAFQLELWILTGIAADYGVLQSWGLDKKDHRVSESTVKDFNFLRFQQNLSAVTIDLREGDKDLKDIDEQRRIAHWKKVQANLIGIFQWLKGPEDTGKGVKGIMRLTVRDNPPYFCSDETIEKCLEGLEIRYLDWNRPDLSAQTLLKAPDLVQVDLYWDGIHAVLCSWSDEKGIGNLQKVCLRRPGRTHSRPRLTKLWFHQLRRVILHAKKGRETAERMLVYVERFKNDLKHWHEHHPSPIKPEVDMKDDDEDNNKSGNLVNTKTGTSKAEYVHYQTEDDPTGHDHGNQWFAQARAFAKAIMSRQLRDESWMIKVAVIDDGVSPTYHGIGECLQAYGWPWNPSRAQEIFTSTNQHGSKMAYLIKSMCPHVKIYVAKLDEHSETSFRQRTFNLEDATKAVEWAANHVDIMCMSWNVRCKPKTDTDPGNETQVTNLQRVVNEAAEKGILMYCAAGDNRGGTGQGQRWVPCSLTNTLSVGATDNNNRMKEYVVDKNLSYLFPGENVLPETDKDSKEVGNSGATAIAAGLAALVLFFTKWKNMGVEKEQRPQYLERVMDSVFKKTSYVVHVHGVLDPNQMERFVTQLALQAST
ncbi:MAG: hypothetical protein Q9185_002562 [Variospora sp. 1 TL-2023]